MILEMIRPPAGDERRAAEPAGEAPSIRFRTDLPLFRPEVFS